jgi:hypothetical protein
MNDYPAPPSGFPPPTQARTPAGELVDLVLVAERAAAGFVAAFPDYADRYGPVAIPWCVHDDQHLLNWAILSLDEQVDYERELAWLARVLEARTFPLTWLAGGLDVLAATVREVYPALTDVAARVDEGAAFIRSRPSFLA